MIFPPILVIVTTKLPFRHDCHLTHGRRLWIGSFPGSGDKDGVQERLRDPWFPGTGMLGEEWVLREVWLVAWLQTLLQHLATLLQLWRNNFRGRHTKTHWCLVGNGAITINGNPSNPHSHPFPSWNAPVRRPQLNSINIYSESCFRWSGVLVLFFRIGSAALQCATCT